MRANADGSDHEQGDPFLSAIRGRIQHEFLDPGAGELKVTLIFDDEAPNPTVMAVVRQRARLAASRFVALFTIDRGTFEAAKARGADPIAAGELVFVRSEEAGEVIDALADVFPRRRPRPRKRRKG